eukprot:753644-Hanusia_phi.AAC.1
MAIALFCDESSIVFIKQTAIQVRDRSRQTSSFVSSSPRFRYERRIYGIAHELQDPKEVSGAASTSLPIISSRTKNEPRWSDGPMVRLPGPASHTAARHCTVSRPILPGPGRRRSEVSEVPAWSPDGPTVPESPIRQFGTVSGAAQAGHSTQPGP